MQSLTIAGRSDASAERSGLDLLATSPTGMLHHAGTHSDGQTSPSFLTAPDVSIAMEFDKSASSVQELSARQTQSQSAGCSCESFLGCPALPQSLARYALKSVAGRKCCFPAYTLPPLHRLVQAFVGALVSILILGAIAQYGSPGLQVTA